jgi:hypothetical protein
MGVIEDMLNALDRIPGWRRLQELPAEVDELKAKVAALEEKLGGKWPPAVCRFCGERKSRLQGFRGHGNVDEIWSCEACGKQDRRPRKST